MPVYQLGEQHVFPPVHHAEEGLLAIGGDLEPDRLLAAYKRGIFPWYSEDDPILWWSPEARMVLVPERIHLSRRFRRTIRKGSFSVSADTCFDQVIRCCADITRKGEDGTWILPEMVAAYERLHALGFAHSVEVKTEGDRLVGGLYGVSLGGVFFGESMFSLERDASKIALAALARQCHRWEFNFIDCQMWTAHLESLGAMLLPRWKFMRHLKRALNKPTRRGPWLLDHDLLSIAEDWPASDSESS